MPLLADKKASPRQATKPGVGFAGVGWIGRHRMEALVESGLIEAAAVADPVAGHAEEARALAPGAVRHERMEALLQENLDGLVIATPSALHAEHAIRALEAGLAVFCQKPLGRTAEETRRVVRAARRADRLLGVDFSYRHTEGMQQIRRLAEAGAVGEVYAADLTFHNAYGPDKPWFYDAAQSGGGCVMDLGIHLVDLALWTLDFPAVEQVSSRLFAKGQPLAAPGKAASDGQVEDYATARLDLGTGAAVSLSCSWNLPAGREAVIEAVFYGTEGGLALRNTGGSFYDFTAERFDGTTRETLAEPPDAWGGRAAVAWAERLAKNNQYDPAVEHAAAVADVIDAIYDR